MFITQCDSILNACKSFPLYEYCEILSVSEVWCCRKGKNFLKRCFSLPPQTQATIIMNSFHSQVNCPLPPGWAEQHWFTAARLWPLKQQKMG